MNEERSYWRTLARQSLFTSRWYNVLQDKVGLPNGGEISYTWVQHPGCAVIVPLNEYGEVVMLRQYRYTANIVSLELPAGGRNPEDADLQACAAREMAEELGLAAHRWTALGHYHAAIGMSDIVPHLFLAEELYEVPHSLDETEREAGLEIVTVPFAEAVAMCYDGRISDGLSIVALLRASRIVLSAELLMANGEW